MKIASITFISLLFFTGPLFAQHTKFTGSGTIEFEKSVNMNAIIKKIYGNEQGSWAQALQQYQKTQPQFRVMKSTLIFADDKTLFTPIAPETMTSGPFNTPLADQINTIYTDLTTHTSVVQKNISDSYLLIKDTLRKIKWKVTDEIRDIAGYPCRRANGLVLDSIYVVAFYTDKITTSGGPESFTGLPGIILEVAIPHENVTWKAVKVTDMNVPVATIIPPKKGKIYTNKQFFDFVKKIAGSNDQPTQVNLTMKGYLL